MKDIILKTSLFIILILGLIFSCENNDSENSFNITQVKYGTSFGECIGYCKRDLTLQSGGVTYKKSGWSDTIAPVICTDILSDSSWNSFQNGLDINAFFSLPTTIGCPDCADGGAEWIEMQLKSGVKHKVTFEYHNEPSALKNYVALLRSLMLSNGNNCP